MDYTLGTDPKTLLYHTHWARSEVSRNMRSFFIDIRDEIGTFFDELIPVSAGSGNLRALLDMSPFSEGPSQTGLLSMHPLPFRL